MDAQDFPNLLKIERIKKVPAIAETLFYLRDTIRYPRASSIQYPAPLLR